MTVGKPPHSKADLLMVTVVDVVPRAIASSVHLPPRRVPEGDASFVGTIRLERKV